MAIAHILPENFKKIRSKIFFAQKVANKQTNRQTDKQTNNDENITSWAPLAEVKT